jgi:hypothetical protein
MEATKWNQLESEIFWNVIRSHLANNFDRFNFRAVLDLGTNNFLFLISYLIDFVNILQRYVVFTQVPEKPLAN